MRKFTDVAAERGGEGNMTKEEAYRLGWEEGFDDGREFVEEISGPDVTEEEIGDIAEKLADANESLVELSEALYDAAND